MLQKYVGVAVFGMENYCSLAQAQLLGNFREQIISEVCKLQNHSEYV